jgi:hypothetical protein
MAKVNMQDVEFDPEPPAAPTRVKMSDVEFDPEESSFISPGAPFPGTPNVAKDAQFVPEAATLSRAGMSHGELSPQEKVRLQIQKNQADADAAKTIGPGEAARLKALNVFGTYPQTAGLAAIAEQGLGKLIPGLAPKRSVFDPNRGDYSEVVANNRKLLEEAGKQQPEATMAGGIASSAAIPGLGSSGPLGRAAIGAAQAGISTLAGGETVTQGKNNLGELAIPTAVNTAIGGLAGRYPAATMVGLAAASGIGATFPEAQIPYVTETPEQRTSHLVSALQAGVPAAIGGAGSRVASQGAKQRISGETEVNRYLDPVEAQGQLKATEGATAWSEAAANKLSALKDLEKIAINKIRASHQQKLSAHEDLTNQLANVQKEIAQTQASITGQEGPAMRSLYSMIRGAPPPASLDPKSASLHQEATLELPRVFSEGALKSGTIPEYLQKATAPKRQELADLQAKEAALKAGPPVGPAPEMTAPPEPPAVPQSEISKYLAQKNTQQQQHKLFSKLNADMPEAPVAPEVAGKQAREAEGAKVAQRLRELRARPTSLTDKAANVVPGKLGAGLRTIMNKFASDQELAIPEGTLERAARQLGEAQKGAAKEKWGGRVGNIGGGLTTAATQQALQEGKMTPEQLAERQDKLIKMLRSLRGGK